MRAGAIRRSRRRKLERPRSRRARRWPALSAGLALLGSSLLGPCFGCRHNVNQDALSARTKTPSLTTATPPVVAPARPPVVLETATSASTHANAHSNSVTSHSQQRAGARDEPKRACHVAAVGDSLTDYRSGGGGYLRWLEARLPESRFDNHGIGGQMVNQMLRRLPQLLQAANYTHVIVFGGVNDLYSDQTANRTNARIESDLLRMYELIRESRAQVIAVTVAPWGGFRRYYRAYRGENTRRLNDWIHERRRIGHVDHVIDAFNLLACNDKLCEEHRPPFNDGLHFGPTGHQRLGEALLNALEGCR